MANVLRGFPGILIIVWAVMLSTTNSVGATDTASNIAAICDTAAQRAARASGVPLDVLRAISLTETGRTRNGRLQPWPWTVNMEGTGKWFSTRAEALQYVERHRKRGAVSFDVGCFQLNFRWHGKAFDSIPHMFDPDANAAYAARFLADLHAEFGDWTKAAGAYHSRTPKYAAKYRKRFNRLREGLVPAIIVADRATPPVQAPATRTATRENRFPLLRTTAAQASIASLVPLGSAEGVRLIDMPGN